VQTNQTILQVSECSHLCGANENAFQFFKSDVWADRGDLNSYDNFANAPTSTKQRQMQWIQRETDAN
jgi:hypothetical protein